MSKIEKNVPELRFKEFTSDWVPHTLGDISSDVSYGMNSSAIKYDGINKYIRITDIDEDSRKFNPDPVTSPDGEIEEKFKLKENDIVFTRTGASVGKTYLYNESDGNLLYAGFLIKLSVINANSSFIFLNTLRSYYDKWILIMSMRSGQPGINAEEIKSFDLNLPSLPEQEKIASFLSSVDNKINNLTKKERAS